MDALPKPLPDDASASFVKRESLPGGISLGHGEPEGNRSFRRVHPVPKNRTPAPPARLLCEPTPLVNTSIESSASRAVSVAATGRNGAAISAGRLIVNADAWGRVQGTT